MKGELYEYNGKQLTLNEIASIEGLVRLSLVKCLSKTSDIYEAIKLAKENARKHKGDILYNGEYLTINKIAQIEGLTAYALRQYYKKVGDIYEAVKEAKESQAKHFGTIEYNGKLMSLDGISQLEHISREALQKQFEELGDIYKAVEIVKNNQFKRKGSILYKGEYLTIKAIARLEDIDPNSLTRYFNELNDINLAVQKAIALRDRRRGNILYKGELLSIPAIAEIEGLSACTLRSHYEKTGDINEAIKEIRQNKILYKGEMLTLNAIANLEKVNAGVLKKNYELTQDIEKAVTVTKNNARKKVLYKGNLVSLVYVSEQENIPIDMLRLYYIKFNDIDKAIEYCSFKRPYYNGKRHTIYEIAMIEGLLYSSLKKYYELYKDIDKAVMVLKASRLKYRRTKIKGKECSYEALSKKYGISAIEIEKLNKTGKLEEKIDELSSKEEQKTGVLMYKNESLHSFCLKNSYNYDVILYMIRTYNKTPEEAVKAYVENGQSIPTFWIYEKYDVLLKHLLLKYGIDSTRIVEIMKEDNLSFSDAIIKYTFRSNNSSNGFDVLEIDWMEELYSFISTISPEEYNEAKETFYVTEREEKFLKDKDNIIKNVLRQLLLYEFAIVIDEWSSEELFAMMNLYGITDEEKYSIVLDLYTPFIGKVIDPRESSATRINVIKEIVTNQLITPEMVLKDENLSIEEKNDIIKKKKLLEKVFSNRNSANSDRKPIGD